MQNSKKKLKIQESVEQIVEVRSKEELKLAKVKIDVENKKSELNRTRLEVKSCTDEHDKILEKIKLGEKRRIEDDGV